MEWLLNFFADLILFTAGLIVLLCWIVGLVLIAIEGHDVYTEHYKSPKEDEDA